MKRLSYILLFLVSVLFVTCKKYPELKIYNLEIVNETVEKTQTSARVTVKYSYPTELKSVDALLSLNENFGDASKTSAKIEKDVFSVEFANLQVGTKYYYRFSYNNGVNIIETEVKSFETESSVLPEVKTLEISNIMQTTATCSGEVVSDGGAAVTERGVCWSKTPEPTLDNEHVVSESGSGAFSCDIGGLEENTTYYVRAYARNNVGMSMGEVKQFKTIENVVEPMVSTVEIKDVTALSAVTVGNVSSDGGAEIVSRGFCWSLSEPPTVDDYYVECEGTTGSFEGLLAELEADETYHVRAFAINSVGTSYGEELTFTTSEGLPVVVTSSVTEITATSAKCGGNVTDEGASSVTECGICWSTNHNPMIDDSHVSGGSGAGTYTCSMTGLTPNATYYVRAYAKNIQGISYGTEVSFEAVGGLPTVTTSAVTSITSTTATGGGNVADEGASNVTERGICWSTDHNPTTGSSHTSSGSGAGLFTAQMSGLASGTVYYVRAYAKNTQGVTYGSEIVFTTTAALPTLTTRSVSEITQTTATGGGDVSSDGGATVTERGICWSTSVNPTTSNNHIASGSGTGNFSACMTGLTAGTTYHVRAYAKNNAGTAYGNDVTFTTTATLPTVTTAQVSNITQTTAQCGGNVVNDGGDMVVGRGVCWNTTPNPTISYYSTSCGNGIGNFTASITGLYANTTYYVKAYAVNNQGVSYGNEVTFTTSQDIFAPTVTTSAVTTITQTTAVGGGNVTYDGGASVIERGICWGTSQNPTTSGTHSNSGTGIGDFTVQMSGLTANTTYYVRAYAVNTAGTSYGNEVSFTTLQNVVLPTITTNDVTDITQNTAICGGNITNDGGGTITARGVCWNVSQNPTIENSHTTDGSGTGTFTSSIIGLSPNTTYYVRAYATNYAGTSYGEQKSFTTGGTIAGHDYVDLGLPSGTLWATCNVGADSPEDYGDYFAWGETETKINYSWSTYKWCNGSYYTLTKYNTKAGYGAVDYRTVLEPEDDAVHVNWGGSWRMPTYDEMKELEDRCTRTWTTQGGKSGYRVTGPNGKSIFLPAAGFYDAGSFSHAGSYGFYWSSSLDSDRPHYAFHLYFDSSYLYMIGYYRCIGQSVRPVCTLSK